MPESTEQERYREKLSEQVLGKYAVISKEPDFLSRTHKFNGVPYWLIRGNAGDLVAEIIARDIRNAGGLVHVTTKTLGSEYRGEQVCDIWVHLD